MSIPSTSTRRPVAVAMLFLAVILLGIISFLLRQASHRSPAGRELPPVGGLYFVS
jgi:hypothetical protein